MDPKKLIQNENIVDGTVDNQVQPTDNQVQPNENQVDYAKLISDAVAKAVSEAAIKDGVNRI